jgi:hypothetical protein
MQQAVVKNYPSPILEEGLDAMVRIGKTYQPEI